MKTKQIQLQEIPISVEVDLLGSKLHVVSDQFPSLLQQISFKQVWERVRVDVNTWMWTLQIRA